CRVSAARCAVLRDPARLAGPTNGLDHSQTGRASCMQRTRPMGPTDAVPEDADLLRGLEDLFPATTGTDEAPAFEDVPAISPSARLPVVEEPIPLPPLPEVVCEEPDLPEESPAVEPGPELPDLAFGPAEALPQPDLDWNEASERPTTHD